MKNRIAQMAQLERENRKWQMRFVDLAQGIDKITGEVGIFEELKLNPENRAGLQKKEPRARFDGIGGPDSDSPFDSPSFGTSRNLVLSMQRAMDDIDDKVSALLSNRTALYTFLEKQNRLLAWVRPVLPGDEAHKLPIQISDPTPPALGGSPEAD
ncbi:MAG: hypothetical protein GY849_11180 [Deltaproteobacteria bacterium]|nr:hypothetical protein [Deltaproteobacteria bacterium]